MVGIGTQVYACDDSLKPHAQENGEVSLEDSEPPTAMAGDGKVNGKVALCPITPNPRGENGDSAFVTNTPLSLESPQSPDEDGVNYTSNDSSMALGLSDSPRTPKEGVFNPFAPGPEELLFAPICKKLVKESRRIVARRLNFDDVDDFPEVIEDGEDAETLSEKMLLDTVYGTLLEAIVMKQAEDFLAENHLLGLHNLCTPSSPRMTGIAETCPGAPMKSMSAKSRKIDPGLCRKLEF